MSWFNTILTNVAHRLHGENLVSNYIYLMTVKKKKEKKKLFG